jgi:hypothetical protein
MGHRIFGFACVTLVALNVLGCHATHKAPEAGDASTAQTKSSADAQSTSFPRDIPMYPQVEESMFDEQHPTTTGDHLSPAMQAAIRYESKLNPGVKSAGAIVLFCWRDIEPKAGEWTFTKEGGSLQTLGEILRGDQNLIIGLRGNACAPSWLADLGVPFVDNFLNTNKACAPMTLPASFNPVYIDRYLKATQALWDALKKVKLKQDPKQTLQDRVLAIRNGVMGSSTSGEMGIFSQGCKVDGVEKQSQLEVAKIWAGLGYTPKKARDAYDKVLEGIFQIVRDKPSVAISQSVLGTDRFGFPLVDEKGVPYAPPKDDKDIVPMFGPIMNGAAKRYKNRIVFGFNELAQKGSTNTIAPPKNVIEAGASGAGIEWQLNGNGHSVPENAQVTSCGGHSDPVPATIECFNGIIAYAMSRELVPIESNGGHLRWIEFWPYDAIGAHPKF